ncbi:hypothetical protein CWB96_03475 [Pseudoalteromonas citrea]|uniref:Potassium channel domain-containing protein n=1 Tax=Pseudoalteromonas citrea TaxID=43655 RepID=A0A5S3XUD1_9GAMM|nr:potassium channel family protein [Pseudoalteromonas citrea]TMP43177.1 hypothetical protein CWB97_09860 [Pseudoalteromonas citrea]TMP61718.1 hypothetical protein CWB96_03475 [Pseudoalteromonas citrea]
MSEKDDQTPDFLQSFIDSATPPEGMGNRHFKLNWSILLMFVPYVTYGLLFFEIPYLHVGLLIYSFIILLIYIRLVSGFKEFMAYESNPFDFVKVQFINFLNIITCFGLIYYFLHKLDSSSFSLPLDLFDGVYFSLVTVSTLGYGEIHPVSKFAKAIAMFELLVGMWFFISVIPVAVADQAERIRNFRAGRQKMAAALKHAHENGKLKKVDDDA